MTMNENVWVGEVTYNAHRSLHLDNPQRHAVVCVGDTAEVVKTYMDALITGKISWEYEAPLRIWHKGYDDVLYYNGDTVISLLVKDLPVMTASRETPLPPSLNDPLFYAYSLHIDPGSFDGGTIYKYHYNCVQVAKSKSAEDVKGWKVFFIFAVYEDWHELVAIVNKGKVYYSHDKTTTES